MSTQSNAKVHGNATHGQSNTKLYARWASIKQRCYNPRHPAYKYYGARGIKMCEEWKNDFLKFKEWVDKTANGLDLTVERVDVNGDYCPQNCIWVEMSQQANNRRSNILFTYRGETHNLTTWCDILNLNYKNVHNRIYKLGWSFEKAVTTPICVSKRNNMSKERNKSGKLSYTRRN